MSGRFRCSPTREYLRWISNRLRIIRPLPRTKLLYGLRRLLRTTPTIWRHLTVKSPPLTWTIRGRISAWTGLNIRKGIFGSSEIWLPQRVLQFTCPRMDVFFIGCKRKGQRQSHNTSHQNSGTPRLGRLSGSSLFAWCELVGFCDEVRQSGADFVDLIVAQAVIKRQSQATRGFAFRDGEIAS